VTLVREIHKSLHNPIWAQVRKPAPWDIEASSSELPVSATNETVACNEASPLNLAA
jgi:hypothetical protein